MAWIHLSTPDSEKFNLAIKEIEQAGSARGIAVVAAAFVEEHLTTLIQSRMTRDEARFTELFRVGGAFGDLGVKIDLAYLMGICSQQAFKELTTIKKIRNAFSHRIEINDFNIQQISDWCRNLVLWERLKIKIRAATFKDSIGATAKRSVVDAKLSLTLGHDLSEGEGEVILFRVPAKMTAQERYVNACKFYIAAATVDVYFKAENVDPLF